MKSESSEACFDARGLPQKYQRYKNPDTSSQFVVVNTLHLSIRPMFHPHRAKDSTGGNLLLTTMAGNAPDKDYIDVVEKIPAGKFKRGKPVAPVYEDSANRPWLKDTMQTKTKVVRADGSKKDGRIVAQPSRKVEEEDNRVIYRTWHWQFGCALESGHSLNGSEHYFTGPNNRSQPL